MVDRIDAVVADFQVKEGSHTSSISPDSAAFEIAGAPGRADLGLRRLSPTAVVRCCVAIPLLGAALLWPMVVTSGKSASIANVRVIVHRLTLLHPHKSAAAAHVHQPLFAADGLQTAARAKASIMFADRALLHINERTDLVLRSPKLTAVSRGEIAVVESPGSQHRIQTAAAITSAVGTKFNVRIERKQATGYAPTVPPSPPTAAPYQPTATTKTFPPGTTTVSVVNGAVRVSNSHGKVTVHAGQWTHVEKGKAPTKPTTHNAKGDVAWTAGLNP